MADTAHRPTRKHEQSHSRARDEDPCAEPVAEIDAVELEDARRDPRLRALYEAARDYGRHARRGRV